MRVSRIGQYLAQRNFSAIAIEHQGHTVDGEEPQNHQEGDPKPNAVSPAVEVDEIVNRSSHREKSRPKEGISEQALVDRIKRSDRWMIVLTAVIAVGGLISAIIFGYQLNEMKIAGELTRESLELSREALKVSERAWLVPRAPSISVPITPKTTEIYYGHLELYPNFAF